MKFVHVLGGGACTKCLETIILSTEVMPSCHAGMEIRHASRASGDQDEGKGLIEFSWSSGGLHESLLNSKSSFCFSCFFLGGFWADHFFHEIHCTTQTMLLPCCFVCGGRETVVHSLMGSEIA